MTRRRVLACGAGAFACACLGHRSSAQSWLGRLLGSSDEAPAEIFKGGAPSDRLWKQWEARGWVREARHYLKLGENTQCKVCPNNCLLSPGDRSHCRNKVNRGGTLYTMAYANPCTFHVDPVEKKPLFHFRPGSATFSLATSGCVFRCLNCQNWEISQSKPEETKDASGPALRFRMPVSATLSLGEMRRLSLLPEDIADVAMALGCRSISYTYSEPTAYYEYAIDCCRAAREAHLRNILVTCGSIEERPFRDLAAFVDAAHVDLKGFSAATYKDLNSGKLEAVLRTLKLYKELGIWFEIINLVVPTYTDKLDEIRRMCDWIAKELGPERPLHFSRFHPQHKLEHIAPTPVDTLLEARDAAKAAGLKHVYIGNVRGIKDAETTFCAHCGKALIERDGFEVTRMRIDEGRCRFCKNPVAGVWA